MEVTLSDPYLRCPGKADRKSEAFGNYTFELNVTVRNCVEKMKDRKTFGEEHFLKQPCLIQTEFKIIYEKSPFYKTRAI